LTHKYYSIRTGLNKNSDGLSLQDYLGLFDRIYEQLRVDGYFDEAFGSCCVDLGPIPGKIKDIELAMLLAFRKKKLWPIEEKSKSYTEDDLFDVIEFLHQHVSKPIDGTMHNYGDCGMHWESFNKTAGQKLFREEINASLLHYKEKFELSDSGELLHKPEVGFEPIFDADLPSEDPKVLDRVNAAILQFRRHASSIDDRRQSVRDLADVLEYLKPSLQELLTQKDESDLFNIANNFGIRHHNAKQKTSYETAIWLSWMFYFYLATIHVVLRKIENKSKQHK
jgi:hypothetical protein